MTKETCFFSHPARIECELTSNWCGEHSRRNSISIGRPELAEALSIAEGSIPQKGTFFGH
jgi:hypothetical protein